jgi:hypothetical protein
LSLFTRADIGEQMRDLAGRDRLQVLTPSRDVPVIQNRTASTMGHACFTNP